MPDQPVFTVLVLLFGDYPGLAERCLGSITTQLPDPHVAEIRLGLNAVSQKTLATVSDFKMGSTVPVRVYHNEENCKKYPVMRHMVHSCTPSTSFVMWFDDDSCISPSAAPGFFTRASEAAVDADVMGDANWSINLQGGQAAWVKDQPWYGGKQVGVGSKVKFATGGWFCARTEVLLKFDWPVPDLLHRGGDVMLGELCRQQDLRLKTWTKDLAINADENLSSNKSLRRGFNSAPVGFHYKVRT